jgi:hypothetical protein
MRPILKTLLIAGCLSLPGLAGAAGPDTTPLQIRGSDTIRTTLEQQTGKAVKLRLKSGQELGGTVARFGNGVVQLSQVSGMEFFDAVVSIDDISAVLIRVRNR